MAATSENNPYLMVFGPGYSASPVMEIAREEGWTVSATWRREEAREEMVRRSIHPIAFDAPTQLPAALPPVTHILTSIAPKEAGDPVLNIWQDWLKEQKPKWIGYLSSTNVYGDHSGDWVDEETPLTPSLDRGIRRVAAEQAWQALADQTGSCLHIFRLAGIYGPSRNAVRTVLDGRARCIIKPGQVFSRIHLADITEALWLAMRSDLKSMAFNLADDEPTPPQEVIIAASKLLGITPPKEESWEEAELSPMARSFYLESKKVRNNRVKEKLGMAFKYPNYTIALPEFVESEPQKPLRF